MFRKGTVNLIILLFITLSSVAQSVDNKLRIQKIYSNINTHLREQKTGLYYESTDPARNDNPHSWLWPLCALLQAANEMEVLNPGNDYMTPVESAVEQYYSDVKPAPAYQDYVTKERLSSRFYDDNQWIAITYMDAYSRKKDSKYLEKSKMIYKFMMTGYDTVSGGGLYWKEGDLGTKNTCSNGPGILVALRLYQLTKNKEYLNTALKLYDWTNKYLRAEDGTYYDAIKLPSLKIDKAKYTYNTGTMLQSNVLLYNLTKDRKYLKEAQVIAQGAKKHFYVNNKLPDHYWFNAVMFRGFIELYKVDKNQEWIDFFNDDAERVWQNERDTRNFLGNKKEKSLIDQAGMLEIYARLEQLGQSENLP
jgi:hypothetical protein